MTFFIEGGYTITRSGYVPDWYVNIHAMLRKISNNVVYINQWVTALNFIILVTSSLTMVHCSFFALANGVCTL